MQGTDRSSRYICLVAWEIDSLRSHNLKLFSLLSSLYVLFASSITVFWHKFWHKKIPSPSLPSTLGCEKREGFVHIIAVSLSMVVEVEQGTEGRTGWTDLSLSPVTRTTNLHKAAMLVIVITAAPSRAPR